MSITSRSCALLCAFILALCCAAPRAFALDPAVGLDGYRHERWGELEGAPRYVDALARSADGWLWVGSRHTGLLRFDGTRFLPYETADGSRPLNNSISVLRPGRDGALWIGYGSGGLSVLRQGRYHHLIKPEVSGSVFAIALDADGAAWIASWRGLFRVTGDRVTRIGPELGYGDARAEYVLADRAGRIWAANGAAVYVRDAGDRQFRLVRAGRGDPMLLEAPDGGVWLVLGKQFERLAPPTPRRIPAPVGSASSFQSLFDRDGNAWSGNCPVGLCVLRPASWQGSTSFTPVGAVERLDQPWQMTSLSVLSLMEDLDGSIWIGTPSGLERLRDHVVHMVPALLDRGISHPAPHPGGGIVAVRTQRLDDTASLLRIEHGKLRELSDPLATRVLDRAPDGTLVFGGRNGIERHGPAGVERIPLPQAVAAAGDSVRAQRLTAGNDDIWLWTGRLGAWHYREGAWTRQLPRNDQPQRAAFDAAGRSFLGLRANRLRIVDRGLLVREYGPQDGLDVGKFSFIEPGDPLLVSGEEGMQVLAGGRFRRLAVDLKEGLGMASGIVADAAGNRWINAERGIYRVTPQDWARSMKDPGIALRGRLFDAADGYLGGGVTGLLSSTVAMSVDGTLWFAGERGLAWIDPRKTAPNPATPAVEVLALSSGARRYAAGMGMELDQGTVNLQIDYAAPSLRMPQKVQFRYRLDGQDWEEAGTRRSAFFQRLRPGAHTFEVMAINESGVPGPVTALPFHIPPRFFETWWFLASCLLAVAAIAVHAYRLRTRRLAARIEGELLARLRERESIARALHDTFLQGVQGMLLRMNSVMAGLPAGSQARAEFERILDAAEQVLEEGRDEVQGLRKGFENADAFWRGLLRDVELIVPGSSQRLTLDAAPGSVERLPVRLRGDVKAIVREALVNALRHTPGPVRLKAADSQRELALTVGDAGHGAGGGARDRAGHFGLQGMRERAAQVGARLRIESGPAGTLVTLAIPVEPGEAVQSRPIPSTATEDIP